MDETLIRQDAPNSPEAEKSVIGSMIMDRDAIIVASELLTGEDFYRSQYGVLFETMVELNNEGMPADLVTLQNRLQQKAMPAEIYGADFLRDLLTAVPTSANVRYYAEIVREKAILRRMIKATEKITADCYRDQEDLNGILENAEKSIFEVIQNKDSGEYVPIRDLVVQSLDSIEKQSRSEGNVTGIATGFIDLDYKTAGLQPSDLILVAARPSMGKTAFVLNIADYAAVKNHVPTAIFSLEMSRDQLVKRMLSMASRVDSQAIRTGNLKDADWLKLVEGAQLVGSSDLIIDDTPGLSVQEMRSRCRKYKIEHNLQLVIIDYLQLMEGSRHTDSRQQEISDISRALKGLARELQVPVIALSQLSRAVEQRPDKRPMLSDLRESGAIEQDADIVMFIYRDKYYNEDSEDGDLAEIIIGKQRNGPTGTVKLLWQPQFTKFVNPERE